MLFYKVKLKFKNELYFFIIYYYIIFNITFFFFLFFHLLFDGVIRKRHWLKLRFVDDPVPPVYHVHWNVRRIISASYVLLLYSHSHIHNAMYTYINMYRCICCVSLAAAATPLFVRCVPAGPDRQFHLINRVYACDGHAIPFLLLRVLTGIVQSPWRDDWLRAGTVHPSTYPYYPSLTP